MLFFVCVFCLGNQLLHFQSLNQDTKKTFTDCKIGFNSSQFNHPFPRSFVFSHCYELTSFLYWLCHAFHFQNVFENTERRVTITSAGTSSPPVALCDGKTTRCILCHHKRPPASTRTEQGSAHDAHTPDWLRPQLAVGTPWVQLHCFHSSGISCVSPEDSGFLRRRCGASLLEGCAAAQGITHTLPWQWTHHIMARVACGFAWRGPWVCVCV